MGTATRFITALGGVFLIALAWGLFGYPIVQTIAEPEYADFPGGATGIVVMLLLMGSVPFGGGVLLLRRAIRAGSLRRPRIAAPGVLPPPDVVMSPSLPAAVDASGVTTRAIEPARDAIGPSEGSATTPEARPRPRRTWLAMTGLALALMVCLVDAVIVLGAIVDDAMSQGATRVILFGAVLLSGFPLAGCLWLAHIGDPEMGRRFIADLRSGARQVRHPAVLFRTSAGRAFVTALVTVPAMILWRQAAPLTGPYALTIFSIVDPIAIIGRRTWWASAFVSAVCWFVLYLVTAATVDILSHQPEMLIGFILPLMVYPAIMALSGLIRFVQWLGGSGAGRPDASH